MNRDKVRNIIETTLKAGSRSPGLFDISKALAIKTALEKSNSIPQVVEVINTNNSTISRIFGVPMSAIERCITDIEATA